MHYRALVVDYDGTIATDGRVDEDTMRALERVRASGRKLLLVTGRILRREVDLVLENARGVGVRDLIARLLASDLRDFAPAARMARR